MKNAVFAALIPLGIVLAACVSVPKDDGGTKKAFVLLSPSQEAQLGDQSYQEILKKEKLSTDARLNAMLQRVGQRIASASGANFNWEFKLIESKEMNAFCLPGGKVAFYTGIMAVLQNEGGMAVVMGHEVAHATMRHGAQRMSQGLVAQGALGVASIALSSKSPQERNLWMGLLGAGASLGVILPFSRSHESEADGVGLRYAAIAGYDPTEGARLWQRFSAAKGGKGPPAWLSTHPNDASRIKNLERLQAEVMPIYEKSARYGIGEKI